MGGAPVRRAGPTAQGKDSQRSLRIMAERSKRPEPELLDEIVGGQAIGGLMEPKDIVGPYLFLASEAAANITGQALNIDRGEVMI